jgi:Cdc6-like AAA superfamily ATPase
MTQNSQSCATQAQIPKIPYFRPIEYSDLDDSDIGHRWKERLGDLKFFQEILRSRSNIFLHGSNGSGKTTFVQDSIKGLERNGSNQISVFVDCIEFYSEKLISICISQQLNGHIASIVSKLKMDKKYSKKITFKLCQNFSGLLVSLQLLHQNIETLKAEGVRPE